MILILRPIPLLEWAWTRRSPKGIYDALIGEVPVEDALVHTKYGDVLPSNKALARRPGSN